jgi:hypothetical protein
MSQNDDEGPSKGQRAFIREVIWEIIEENKARIGSAYAKAEAEGRVPRKSNEHEMDAQHYGERLVDDARRKGWL